MYLSYVPGVYCPREGCCLEVENPLRISLAHVLDLFRTMHALKDNEVHDGYVIVGRIVLMLEEVGPWFKV